MVSGVDLAVDDDPLPLLGVLGRKAVAEAVLVLVLLLLLVPLLVLLVEGEEEDDEKNNGGRFCFEGVLMLGPES